MNEIDKSHDFFTWHEIRLHDQPDDGWIVIDNMVFDVTKFMHVHPGGKDMLLKSLGKDVTEEYNSLHDHHILPKYIPKLCIGRLYDSDHNNMNNDMNNLNNNNNNKNNNNKYQINNIEPTFVQKNMDERSFGDMIPYADPSWYQSWTSPYYNSSHRATRAAVRHFVEIELLPYVEEWDEDHRIPPIVIRRFAKSGFLPILLGMKWPKQYLHNQTYSIKCMNGVINENELDFFHELILLDELSRCASCGLNWGLFGGVSLGLPPIIRYASDYLKNLVVAPVLNGDKFICLCVTEPFSGSNINAMKTRAEKTNDGDYFIVNGAKKWVTNGLFADYFVTACRYRNETILLLIERNMKGVTTSSMKCSGAWASVFIRSLNIS